ncbi:MAG: hypothetical protein KGH59_03825 [Candidatus Micrarchaeota archaeon]|nr:hypothetical protein [Candidatus Micrarchaeota archaeon]MDE1804882.1 hypothetical protein [Candidatus Micrarchaeota archaeon]MDE1847156.1 hypothetical protein [Candidatus Micrarchaeota archaeon]
MRAANKSGFSETQIEVWGKLFAMALNGDNEARVQLNRTFPPEQQKELLEKHTTLPENLKCPSPKEFDEMIKSAMRERGLLASA